MVVEQSLQVYLLIQPGNTAIRPTSKIQQVRHRQMASEIKTKMYKNLFLEGQPEPQLNSRLINPQGSPGTSKQSGSSRALRTEQGLDGLSTAEWLQRPRQEQVPQPWDPKNTQQLAGNQSNLKNTFIACRSALEHY